MKRSVWFAVWFALGLVVAAVARPQSLADILRTWDGLTVRSSWPQGTQSIECTLQTAIPAGTVLATVTRTTPPANDEITFPLVVPVAAIRCRACNQSGCSDLSPNLLRIRQRLPGDCNGDGVESVSDILCTNTAIFTPDPW